MNYIKRSLEKNFNDALLRGKSVLLLGPRQTGKTTLVNHFKPTWSLSFIRPDIRQRYEQSPGLLTGEIEALSEKNPDPLVALDEVQKIPQILDVVQDLIDRRIARFILTGSSARKLRRNSSVNLLPGRVIALRMDPLCVLEIPKQTLEQHLTYGSLPGIIKNNSHDANQDLESYVVTYLEEEVRSEALVRNIGPFARFMELAALEAGNIINLRKLSQEIGVAHTTIASYFEILEDCLIIERISPITASATRKKLTQSPKYLFFDMGVRRLCAKEGATLHPSMRGKLFEQFVGLELIRYTRLFNHAARIRFWRDPAGPEIDWVIEQENTFIPIEVKYTDKPSINDAKHLITFLKEYPQAKKAYIVCQTKNPVKITASITAISWQELSSLF